MNLSAACRGALPRRSLDPACGDRPVTIFRLGRSRAVAGSQWQCRHSRRSVRDRAAAPPEHPL